MSDPKITFTCEHEERTFRVDIAQGDKTYAVYATVFGTGKISISPFSDPESNRLMFNNSDPNTILAIGRLLVEIARKFGATDE